jgi:uncharacterized protein (TIGR03435 family)
MMDLIRLAFGFEPESIFGGPDWLEFDRFDIRAKAPPSTSPQDLQVTLRQSLAKFNDFNRDGIFSNHRRTNECVSWP